MKKKILRILPLAVLAATVVVIPASTQGLWGSSAADGEGVGLSLLVLVNRMELTPEQMTEIHDILVGIQAEQEERAARLSELEEQMIAFNGSAEELEEILETFRSESQEQAESSRERVADAVDRIKEILTLKQGEVLSEVFPGLLGSSTELGAEQMMMGRRLGGGNDTDESGGVRGRIAREINDRRIEGSIGEAGLQGQMLARGMRLGDRGSDIIGRLIEVLELKLDALEQ
jgi:TolA-binding protein